MRRMMKTIAHAVFYNSPNVHEFAYISIIFA